MISRKKNPPLEGLPLDKVLSYVLLHLLLSPPAVPDGGEIGGQIWNIIQSYLCAALEYLEYSFNHICVQLWNI